MGVFAALRFKLMFAWVAFLRRFLPYATANNLASGTVHFLHPGIARDKANYLSGLTRTLQNQALTKTAWQRHKALVGVTRLQGSYYSQSDTTWINQCDLSINGAEHIQCFHEMGKGVLVMTYHHHFNMLFCNLLSRLNLPITTIAMDARDNVRYQKFGGRIDRIYEHAQKLLNGGDIILVKPQSPARPILRAFENNHLVITANDFPKGFDDKNREDFDFLESTLSCPTGTVKLAVKKNIPIVTGYLDWLGANRFEMHIHPVSDGGDIKVNEAMANYLAVLEDLTKEQPGLWEGWKWLQEK